MQGDTYRDDLLSVLWEITDPVDSVLHFFQEFEEEGANLQTMAKLAKLARLAGE